MGLLKIIRALWNHGFLRDPADIGLAEGEDRSKFNATVRRPMMTFPAQAWSVPAAGPNEPGPSRAEQLYSRLVDYEFDILFEAAGLPTPSREASIGGAAYNECFSFLRKGMMVGIDGKPTELGHRIIAMKQAAMIVASTDG